MARVSASPREVKEKREYSLFSSLFSLNERTKPIKIDDKAFDKKSITPTLVLLKVTVPTAVIIKPQPPQKLKHIKRFACSSSISPASKSSSLNSAPVGYPPTRPKRIAEKVSKYSPTEFIPGCIYYQGDHSPNEAERLARGYSSAWLHHKGRNKHHLEYWIDYSTRKVGLAGMKMPLRYVCEMVCDRVAASQIYLGDKYTDASPWEYYERSKTHYLLHPETRALLEELLKMVRDLGHDRTFEHMKYLLGCENDY